MDCAGRFQLDKRLRTLREAGSLTVGPMLLAYCQKKPEETLRGAATGVAVFLTLVGTGMTRNHFRAA